MPRFPRTVATRLFPAGLCALFVSQALFAQTTVRSIKVLGGKDAVEIEVESSGKLVPQTQALTGPDRLVIDFPNATPGGELRSQSVNVGEIKDLFFTGLIKITPDDKEIDAATFTVAARLLLEPVLPVVTLAVPVVAEVQVTPVKVAGTVSVTVAPVTLLGPLLVTVIV